MFILTGIWIILNEELSVKQVFIGLFISIIVLLFTNSQLLLQDYTHLYRIRLTVLMRYTGLLLVQIYKSGLIAIWRIIKGIDSVCVTTYQSELEDDFSLMLLANAITLTPGTVTLDVKDQVLSILHFEQSVNSKTTSIEQLIQTFEQVLRKNQP